MTGRDSSRVVITGMGCVTPLGHDAETVWRNILAGRSGVGPITHFDATDYCCRIAAEVRGFDAERFIERKEARKMDRFSHFAIAATGEALEDAGYEIEKKAEPGEGPAHFVVKDPDGNVLLVDQHK